MGKPLYKQLEGESDSDLLDRVAGINAQVEQDNARLGTVGYVSGYRSGYANAVRKAVVARELHTDENGEQYLIEQRDGDRFNPESAYCKRVEARRANKAKKTAEKDDRLAEARNRTAQKEALQRDEQRRRQRELERSKTYDTEILYDRNDYDDYNDGYEQGNDDRLRDFDNREHSFSGTFVKRGYQDGYYERQRRYRYQAPDRGFRPSWMR